MNRSDLENDIAATAFLAGMSANHIETLARCARRLHFHQDKVIFRQGEIANRFYLIEKGTVQLEAAVSEDGSEIAAGTIGSGGVLGWSWLLPPYECLFTARALSETSALFFYGTLLREYSEADPSLGFELLKRMASGLVERLEATRERLVESVSGFSAVGAEHPIASDCWAERIEN